MHARCSKFIFCTHFYTTALYQVKLPGGMQGGTMGRGRLCRSVHDVCTRCLYTMSVHYTWYAGGCLCSITRVCIGIFSRHPSRPPLGQAGPSIAPEAWHVALNGTTRSWLLPQDPCRPLTVRCDCTSEYVFAMDMLAVSRLTFRQDQTAQPFVMVG